MKRFRIVFAAASVSLSLAACSTVGYMSNALLDPPERATVADPAHGDLEIYSFDTAADPDRAIFFVSGSGCASLRYYLKQYFTGLDGSYRVYALQKTGVGSMAAGGKCNPDFNEAYTAETLISRNRAALQWVANEFPGQIAAVVGVSEGGTIAAALATDRPSVERIVIIGSGGMTFREELEILAKRRDQETQLLDGLKQVVADPDSTTASFMGMPHRYLTSMLDLDPMTYFDRTTQPILLIAGEADESVPTASVTQLYSALAERPGQPVQLQIVSQADHTLRSSEGDRKPEIMARLSGWLDGEGWSPLD